MVRTMASNQDEAAAQNAIIDGVVRDTEAAMAKVIAQAMNAATDAYEATGKPTIPDTLMPDVQAALANIWGRAGRMMGQRIIGQVKDGYRHLETKAGEESLFQRILIEFIQQFGALRVTQIVEATREGMMRVIASGLKQGLSVEQIAKDLRENIPLISRLRANVIARTETHSASQHASIQVAKTSRLTLMKEWVPVEDHRTRDFGEGDGIIDQFSHRAMTGQRVPVDHAFKVPRRDGTFENMMFPGDPNGSAGNVINCRCANIFRRAD